MDLFITSLEQGLIFGIMAIGVYITYRILDFPDLSVDGTFPLGASVTAFLLIHGISPTLAIIFSCTCGMMAGAMTGLLHVKLKITNLLAGILVMISLYSINLRIMGKANLPLFNYESIFNIDTSKLMIIFLIALLIKLLFDIFMKTKFGFLIKVTGDNETLVHMLGLSSSVTKICALMISNGLVALSGSLMAQYQGFSDISMGSGIIVMGLASVIFGEALFKKNKVLSNSLVVMIGAWLYQIVTILVLQCGFAPSDLKLMSAIFIIVALFIPTQKNKIMLTIKQKLVIKNTLRGEQHVKNTKRIKNI